MTRTIAMIAALVSATISISSTCIARPTSELLQPLKHVERHVSPTLLAQVSSVDSELLAG